MTYLLCPLSSDQMNVLYGWKVNEPNWDLYTCRLVGKLAMKHEFAENLKKEITQGILQVYIIATEPDMGKTT